MLVISTQNFPPEIGGIENLMYELCQSLAVYDDPFEVYADHKRGLDIKKFDQGLAFAIHRSSGLKPLRRRAKAKKIHRLLNNYPAGACSLIADSWKSLEFIKPELFSKVICLAHGTEIPRDATDRKMARIRASLNNADFVVANSNYTAGLVTPYISNAARVRIIYPGIMEPQRDAALEQRIAESFRSHSPVIITVARLERRKAQRQIINLMPDLVKRFPGLLYVMVGSGSELDYLQKTVSQLGIEDHIHFAGALVGAQKNAYLANSDLFVMPSTVIGQDIEGFGIAYIEAGYFSIPAIATYSGGAPDAVIHEKTGLLCDPDDLDQLAKNIFRLLDDKGLRQTLGENAARRSRELLWKNQVHAYRQLLYES